MKQSIEYELQKTGLPIISIKCNDFDLYFLLDTGSSANHLMDYAYQAILENANALIKDSPITVNTSGMDGIMHELKVCYLKFNIEENEYNEEFVVTPDSETFKRVSYNLGESLCGIIGTTFLKKHKIIIDFDEKCVRTNDKEQEKVENNTEETILVNYDIDEIGPIIAEYDIFMPDL